MEWEETRWRFPILPDTSSAVGYSGRSPAATARTGCWRPSPHSTRPRRGSSAHQSWRISRISPTVCKDKRNSLGSWFNTLKSTDFLSSMLKQSELTVISQLESLPDTRKEQTPAQKGTGYELHKWQNSKSSRDLFACKDGFNSFCAPDLKISSESYIYL